MGGVALAVLLVLAYGFWPEAIEVDTAAVQRGPLQVVVEEEGETELENTYVLSSPVQAFARRVELEPGDVVEQGQPVILLEPPRSTILDPRSAARARAGVAAAQAALEQARQSVESSSAAAVEAREERDRMQGLFEEGSATQQQLTRAEAAAAQAEAALESARAAVAAANADLQSARAALETDAAGAEKRPVTDVLYAPIRGSVLAVHHKSAGQVNPGEPLIEIGDVDDLEVHADVLSQDAVRIAPGTRVLLDQWGGNDVLEATVTRIEPRGFTEVSSLGVEEKRVRVIAQPVSPVGEWTGLGAGYRVLARFVLFEGDDVLLVPMSALFRTDDGWAAFVVEDGEAVRRAVDIGWQSGLSAEVVGGLEEGDEVIVHPAADLEPGVRVEPRAR